MADNVSMTIKSTSQTGKKLSRSITDISPNATDSQMETLGNALNALTNNHLSSLTRVQTSEIDTSQRYNLTAQITTSDDTYSAVSFTSDSITIDKSKLSDSHPLINVSFMHAATTVSVNNLSVQWSNMLNISVDNSVVSSSQPTVSIGFCIDVYDADTPTGTMTLIVPQSDLYNAFTLTVNVTGGN